MSDDAAAVSAKLAALRQKLEASVWPTAVAAANSGDHERIRDLVKLKVDIVTARACAPMTKLLGFAEPYLHRGATGLFLKGQDVATELTEARKTWSFASELLPSQSDPRGRIVQVKRLSRVR